MADEATATLTFLFSDIEGSTRLLQALGPAYPDLLAEHDRIIRSSALEHGGRPFGSEGDAQSLVFHEATGAVRTGTCDAIHSRAVNPVRLSKMVASPWRCSASTTSTTCSGRPA